MNTNTTFMESLSDDLKSISSKLWNFGMEIASLSPLDEQEDKFNLSMQSDLDKLHYLINSLAGRATNYHNQRELINAGAQKQINEATLKSIFEEPEEKKTHEKK